MRRLLLFAIFLMSGSLIGCGYLDTDLSMSDEEFEETMGIGGIGGIGMRGVGRSGGCGGVGIARGRAAKFRRGHSNASMQEINLGDFHIYGRASRGAGDAAAGETNVAVAAAQPEPVDWVGHFDHVSAERQNVLLAAWVEGQLNDEAGDSAETGDLVDARGEVEVGQR